MAGPWVKFRTEGGVPTGVLPPDTNPVPPSGPWTKYQGDGPIAPKSQYEDLTWGETAEDVGKAVVSKPGEAAISIPGIPGEAGALAVKAKRWAMGEEPLTEKEMDDLIALPRMHEMTEAYEEDTGVPFYQPKGRLGNIAGASAGAVPEALLMGGGIARALTEGGPVVAAAIRDAFRYGAFPAAGSEVAGQFTEGTPTEPWARLAAALGLSMDMRKAVTPFPASPTRQRHIDTLTREGISDLTAGQRTGRDKLRYFESELGGDTFQRLTDSGKEQYNMAALDRVGWRARRVTKDTMDNIFDDVGGEFDTLTRNHNIDDTHSLLVEIPDIIHNHFLAGRPESEVRGLQGIAERINRTMDPANGYQISGTQYQNLRSDIERLARGAGDNYSYASSLRDMKNALDDAMEDAISRNAPDDLGLFQDARGRYRDLLVIERALAIAPAAAADGFIQPAALDAATQQIYGRRNWARGRDNFSELAAAGRSVMKEMPQSGTAARTAARNVGIPGVGAGVGGWAGHAASGGDAMSTALGVAAGVAVPIGLGKLLLSRAGRNYLGNQVLQSTPATASGLTAALINSGAWAPPDHSDR